MNIVSDPFNSLDKQPSVSVLSLLPTNIIGAENTDSAASKVESCDEQLSIKEMVKKYSASKHTIPCFVLLERLPQAELKKYGL